MQAKMCLSSSRDPVRARRVGEKVSMRATWCSCEGRQCDVELASALGPGNSAACHLFGSHQVEWREARLMHDLEMCLLTSLRYVLCGCTESVGLRGAGWVRSGRKRRTWHTQQRRSSHRLPLSARARLPRRTTVRGAHGVNSARS